MLNLKVNKIPRPFKSIPLKRIIAINIKALMDITPALDTQEKLSKKTGIGQATISRTINAITAPNSNLIEKVAKAFRVEPWQLLVPGMNPHQRESYDCPPNETVLLDQLAAIREILDRGPFTPRS